MRRQFLPPARLVRRHRGDETFIKKYGVEDKVDLQASFCMGNCTNGVSLRADEMLLHNANKDNCEELFLSQIYPLLA